MTDAPPKPIRFGDLGRRLFSGLTIAAIALVDLWLGGLWVAALLALALAVMLWEMHRMVTGDDSFATAGVLAAVAAGIAAVFATLVFGFGAGAACLAVGAAVVLVVVPERRAAAWLAGGLGYMGLAMCALIVLRHLEPNGILLVLWLVLVVVAADVGAYFVGRLVGGPRLWPRVSPGKTWSGALGGIAFALLIGVPVGVVAGFPEAGAFGLSLGIAIASQLGDLLELAVKRRFGVKDTSHLIPGHGGVMDRLDGIMGGVWFVAICGTLGMGSFG